MSTRHGTVLIMVSAISALLVSLSIAFLARVRSDVEDGDLQLKLAQARVTLVAACQYIQEASRIGWDIQGWDTAFPSRGTLDRTPNAGVSFEHPEAFGWIDVRDGSLGPRITSLPGSTPTQLIGSRPQEETQPVSTSAGSWRFPIGKPVRFDLFVPQVTPYAISQRATYNPVETSAPDLGRAYLRYPDPQPVNRLNNWRGTSTDPANGVDATEFVRWKTGERNTNGDLIPRQGTLGRTWFRLVREPSGAVFTVTCGAGGTRGFKDWDEVMAAGFEARALFNDDRRFFAAIAATELRLFYRVEWSPATTVIDMNYLREHEEFSFRVSTPTQIGGDPDRNYSGQQMAPNMGGTIQWIQRLRQEPTVW